MTEEKIIDVKSDFTMRSERIFRKKVDAWERKAKEAKIPICLTCIRFDHSKGRLVDDWEHYSGNKYFKKVGETIESEVRNSGRKIVQKAIEWQCKNGHRRTDMIPLEDLQITDLLKSGKEKNDGKTSK